ncbi:MAG: peptidoglycan DD-metalloendopeptidase family protein, partial [Nocardioidaceae bacterium]|nr:peptidoglycan DD-metalloendopeptidase family protein [Nocardioidaceae bacterium]
MSKVIIGGLVMLFLGPAAVLLSLAAILNPSAEASCLPSTSVNFMFPVLNAANTPAVGEFARVVFPLPKGTWIKTSEFGMRRHPITGIYKLHSGTDFAAPSGTPILAAADGQVAAAGPSAGYGNLILIEHTVAGQRVA